MSRWTDIRGSITSPIRKVVNNPFLNPIGVGGSKPIEAATGMNYEDQLKTGAVLGGLAGAAGYGTAANGGMVDPVTGVNEAGMGVDYAGSGAALAPSAAPIAGGAAPFSWSNPSTYPWQTIIPTAATIAGGVLQSSASKDAAEKAAAASALATAENRRQYDLSRLDMQPWLTSGTKALGELGSAYGLDGTSPNAVMDKVRATPGYQFRLGEGLKGIEGGAAARGGLFSGRTGKALSDYGQDYATNEFGNYVNRLSNLAGVGQAQSQNLANLGQNYSTNFGNLTTNAANVAGADAINRGNIWGSTLTGLSNIYANRR